METLRYGTPKQRKRVLENMKLDMLKTLINIIGHVLETRRVQPRYADTFATLLDKKVSLREKMSVIRRDGHKYLPKFLKIVGKDVEIYKPKEYQRTLKDCPLCEKTALVKLSNHLFNVHKYKERKNLLKQAKNSEK